MAEILEAAGFIHFSGYCYNDFKPSNIIARENNEDDSAPSLTLIDFNLITRIGDKPKRGGTLHYLAPEVLCGYPPSIESDIYSLGVLFYQLLTGSLPYDSEIESELIADIINAERIDFEAVPPELRSGLGCLLLHDSEKRPQNTLQAARALGVADTCTVSRKSRIDYYLKSGPPPFAQELRKRFDQFRKSTARKLFYINGYYNGTCPMKFLESEYRAEGKKCFRISREINNDDISKIFNEVITTAKSVRDKKIILIDDLEKLDSCHSKILYDIIKNREDIRIAAAGGRWVNSDIKREIFDPLKLWSGKRSAEEALKAFLKRDVPEIDLDSLQNQTGGDPVQIYNIVRHYYKLTGTTIEDDINSPDRLQPWDAVSENRFIYQKIYASLDPDQRELIAMLSAWGNTIPLLMFVNFERKKRDIVESLINRGFLIRHRDSVSFFSGGFRKHIYDGIAAPMRKDYHKFWAIAAEEFIGDNEERLELTAYHWGLSGDTERGYKYNEPENSTKMETS
jgi:serine/threonine protein kinase